MSRIGKQPVPIPQGAKVTLKDREIKVEGPKGSLHRQIPPTITVEVDEAANRIVVKRSSDLKQDRSLHGLTRSLIANMVHGVTEGYVKKLQVVGVGYSAKLDGDKLTILAGYANPVVVPIPKGITVEKPEQVTVPISGVGSSPGFLVTVNSADKELIGMFAAGLRNIRPPEPYKGKGIRYHDETVKIKPGKAFVSGE